MAPEASDPIPYDVNYIDRVIANVERVQRTLCAYGGSIPCDCKYGGPAGRAGSEQTGCPELRECLGLLRNLKRVLSGDTLLSPAEWKKWDANMQRFVES